LTIAGIEMGSVGNQFGDSLGRLAHDVLNHVAITQRSARHQRILHVIAKSVRRVEHARNAALGIGAA
jgi:hypothetical protein